MTRYEKLHTFRCGWKCFGSCCLDFILDVTGFGGSFYQGVMRFIIYKDQLGNNSVRMGRLRTERRISEFARAFSKAAEDDAKENHL